MSRASRNPFALAQAARSRARPDLLKAKLKAEHDAGADEYLRDDVVVPAPTVQVSEPGLYNSILDRLARPRAIPLDELDEATQQVQELFRLLELPVERVLEAKQRKLEDTLRDLEARTHKTEEDSRTIEATKAALEETRRQTAADAEATRAIRAKGGQKSGQTRAETRDKLDAEVWKILPTLPASYPTHPYSTRTVAAVRDKLPPKLRKRYSGEKGSAISRSIVRVRAAQKIKN